MHASKPSLLNLQIAYVYIDNRPSKQLGSKQSGSNQRGSNSPANCGLVASDAGAAVMLGLSLTRYVPRRHTQTCVQAVCRLCELCGVWQAMLCCLDPGCAVTGVCQPLWY